mmetsp:Transcript_84465/g.219900  ORF Transcript_84465/g.219900 Transcript_84465/m.219900 type:complete len:376 (-) Transcript_84465:402-1529(-)
MAYAAEFGVRRSRVAAAADPRIPADLDMNHFEFERSYIGVCVHIQEWARSLILQVVELDSCVRLLEAVYGPVSQPSRQGRGMLVSVLEQVSAAANTHGSGREDLGVDILDQAYEIRQASSDESDARYVVASLVIDAFDQVCQFFRQLRHHPEHIDPCLWNNGDLVDRFVGYQESLEVAVCYLGWAPPLDALSRIVRRLQSLRCVEQPFEAMCEVCDAEVFMVLPRLVWLLFLQSPKEHAALMATILPDDFTVGEDADVKPDDELEMFVLQFKLLSSQLTEYACELQADVPSDFSVEEWVLVGYAIRGGADHEGHHSSLDGALAEQLQNFMRALEAWSIKLQRWCPVAWNSCSAILLRCLNSKTSTACLKHACIST